MSLYLVDSDAVIDYLQDVSATADMIEGLYDQGDKICVCDVVLAEVYSGLDPAEYTRAELLLGGLTFVETSREAAKRAGEWRYVFRRQGRQLSTTDALIAATAVLHQATLVTGNVSDFPMTEVSVLPLPRTKR